jgi:hypothetical protein
MRYQSGAIVMNKRFFQHSTMVTKEGSFITKKISWSVKHFYHGLAY